MDVTSRNFENVLEDIYNSFDKACFIAIDTEFTSLKAHLDVQNSTITDSIQEDYLDCVKRIKDTRILQVGLCIFQCNEDHSFTARPYNFNLFPESIYETIGNSPYLADTFACQISSISFLASYGFDFTKCFRDGIPYINNNQDMKIQKAFADGYLQDEFLNVIRIYLRNKETREPINLWLPCDRSAPIVKLYLQDKFPGLIVDVNTSQNIRISKQDNYETYTEHESIYNDHILNRIRGFRRLFVEMIKRKIPIVGHNCFTDILLIFQSFYRELPVDVENYIHSVHNDMFPKIWDTKYIIKALKSKRPNIFQESPTSLSSLYNYIRVMSSSKFEQIFLSKIFIPSIYDRYLQKGCKQNEEICDDGLPNMDEKGAAHEAGYDAWMTGVCLIRMADVMLSDTTFERNIAFDRYEQVLSIYDNFVNVISRSTPYFNFSISNISMLPVIPSYVYKISGADNYSYLRSIIRHIDLCEVIPSQNVIKVRGEHSRNYLEKALLSEEVVGHGISFKRQSIYIKVKSHQIFSTWFKRRTAAMLGSGFLALCIGVGIGFRLSSYTTKSA